MKCENCGTKFNDGNFCPECGTKNDVDSFFEDESKQEKNENNPENATMNQGKKKKGCFSRVLNTVVGVVLVCFIIVWILSIGDTLGENEDEHVLAVKNATHSSSPGKTYEEAFEDFFSEPTWKYFKGTKEGTDEDGDGVADTTEEDVDIVEFTGYCTYQDVRVKALIQFTLSNTDDTFEATFLSFNDVPQNRFVLAGLIATVFDDDKESTPIEETTEATTEETTEKISDISDSTDETVDEFDYASYGENGFINWDEINGSYYPMGTNKDYFEISMYSSLESEYVGTVSGVLQGTDGGDELQTIEGEIEEVSTNVYQLTTEYGEVYSFGFIKDSEFVYLDVYADGEYLVRLQNE